MVVGNLHAPNVGVADRRGAWGYKKRRKSHFAVVTNMWGFVLATLSRKILRHFQKLHSSLLVHFVRHKVKLYHHVLCFFWIVKISRISILLNWDCVIIPRCPKKPVVVKPTFQYPPRGLTRHPDRFQFPFCDWCDLCVFRLSVSPSDIYPWLRPCRQQYA